MSSSPSSTSRIHPTDRHATTVPGYIFPVTADAAAVAASTGTQRVSSVHCPPDIFQDLIDILIPTRLPRFTLLIFSPSHVRVAQVPFPAKLGPREEEFPGVCHSFSKFLGNCPPRIMTSRPTKLLHSILTSPLSSATTSPG